MSSDGIEWQFIPPFSPHFGGIWEAGVKSVKHHLRRAVADHTLTVEEFNTLLCQIEACLNSRPLTPLSSDPLELTALTPGHFLVGRPLCALPESYSMDLQASHLSRWKLIQAMRDRIWRDWRSDYLATLHKRYKWRDSRDDLSVGDMVLVLLENHPPAKWPLGRVVEVYRGPDGLRRVCKVRLANTELIRSVHKICRLPIEEAKELHVTPIAPA